MSCCTISNDFVRLVPFSERHLTEEYVSWLNDADLMRYSEQRHRRHTLATCAAYMESFRGSANAFWAIEALDQDGLHVGNINAYVDANNLVADMGLLVGHKQARRRGYGLQAWLVAMAHLFDASQMRKVTAGTMSTNRGMRRIAELSGMEEDGVRKRHFLCEGQEVDIIYYAKFRNPTPQ